MSGKPSPFSKLKGLTGPETTSLQNQSQNKWSLISTSKLEGGLEVLLEALVPSPFQIRTEFNQLELQELAEDIKVRGILQPLVVRVFDEEKYEIIAGERRFRAAKIAGLQKVPVLVKAMNDQDARFAMLVENIQRKDLPEVDEQNFFKTLQAEYNFSITDISKLIHKSRDYVRNRLEGKLQHFKPAEVEQLNSDENHDVRSRHKVLEKSQSSHQKPTRSVKINPAAFTRFARTVNDTLQLLNEQDIKKETREQLIQSVEESIEALLEIRHKLKGAGSQDSEGLPF